MSLSSLQKKMTTTKSLLFVFLVGLLSLTFFVFNAKQVSAASVTPITTSTSNWTTTTIQYNWVKGVGGDEMFFAVASSSDGVTFHFATTTLSSTTLSYTFTGLATNTGYYFLVAAVSSTNQATSTAASSSLIYTLAADSIAPTVASPATSSIYLTLVLGTNPDTTQFSIFNTTTRQFIGLTGTATGAATSSVDWRAASTWNPGGGLQITGLTPNTSYQFVVTARNGSNTTTATSTESVAQYTLTNAPTSAGVTGGANGLTFSWTGDSTAYYAEDITAGTNSTWTTATSLSTGSLNCGTSHSFRVKGRNAESTETAWSDTGSGTTSACGTAIFVNNASSGGIPAIPATHAVPGVSPAVPATPATPALVSLPASASPVAVFVHTLKVGSRSNEVKLLQAKLRELGYFIYPTNTGYFGRVTKAAVVAFQKAYGLKPFPGHVGPATRAALNNL